MRKIAVQRIGNSLNEEYIHNDKDVMENPGFINYRDRITLDVPFIRTEIVEVFKPNHPFGERGIGDAPIILQITAV